VYEMEEPSLLCLIVDCDAESWKQRHSTCTEGQVNFSELVSAIVLFCNTYSTMHRQNRLQVIACGRQLARGCSVIYPRTAEGDDWVPQVHTMSQILSSGLVSTQEQDTGKIKIENFFSRALATALCTINRQVFMGGSASSQLQPRILVAQLSKDHAPSHNNVMNCIFSADKAGVPIDALVLKASEESQFLQQACYMTRGIYQRPVDQRDTLQQLLAHSLPSTATRNMLCAPQQKVVEFKASCFCHKKPVEFAFMCSVCLALTCKKTPVCNTCGTTAASGERLG